MQNHPHRAVTEQAENQTINPEQFAVKHQIQPQIRNHPRFQKVPKLTQELLDEYNNIEPKRLNAFQEKLDDLFEEQHKWVSECISTVDKEQKSRILFLLYKLAEYDIDTFWHSCRVAKASYEFAAKFSFTHDEFCLYSFYHPQDSQNFFHDSQNPGTYIPSLEYIQKLTIGALLHDLGKIGIKKETLQQGSGQFQSARNIGTLTEEIANSISNLIKAPEEHQAYLIELARNLKNSSESNFKGNPAPLDFIEATPINQEIIEALSEIRSRLLPFIMHTFDTETPNNSFDMFKTIQNLCQLDISQQSKEILESSFGLLTNEQREEMNTHSAITKYITDSFGLPDEIGYIGINHHQQGNRYPYPRNIDRSNFTAAEGIVNLMDGFVAMREARIYRPPKTLNEVIQIILEQDLKENLFHPYLLRNLQEMIATEHQFLEKNTAYYSMPSGEFTAITDESLTNFSQTKEPPIEEPNLFHLDNINRILGLQPTYRDLLIASEPFHQLKDPKKALYAKLYLKGKIGIPSEPMPLELEIPDDLELTFSPEWIKEIILTLRKDQGKIRPECPQLTDSDIEQLFQLLADDTGIPVESIREIINNQKETS